MAKRISTPVQKKQGKVQQDSLFQQFEKAGNSEVERNKQILQYGWDLIGILLFAAAFILLLGFFQVTSGELVTPLVDFLTRWFGLGRFLIVVAMVAVGLQVVRWRKYPLHKLSLGRILAFEGIGFLFLAVLSIATSGVVTQVEAG
ncbi:MAG TPA: hypothetical protein PLA02_07175, partial [Brevefilum fermentans]|nr:hypothetical protein [Brevefilum fermentans]